MTDLTILLTRHGQTDWNKAGRWQGHADIPLNETGQQQANALCQRLQSWPIEAIYTSDLQRCVQTAVPLANALKLKPILTQLWRERDVGDFSGLTGEQAREQYPEIWAKSVRGMVDPPNGEPFVEVRRRALRAFESIVEAHSEGTVLVVTHGGLLHALLGQVMGIDAGLYGRFSMRGNTGLSIVEVNSRGPVVVRLNDTSHLE
ncbi:histidine phosphatase family protein [Candidatus Leptofilum sp.]|uniref:histidine phosphatase family protein n=1 Tax=Candidatus Leptofilum sp. TaxID=3241576 RepID=UPI003B5AC792